MWCKSSKWKWHCATWFLSKGCDPRDRASRRATCEHGGSTGTTSCTKLWSTSTRWAWRPSMRTCRRSAWTWPTGGSRRPVPSSVSVSDSSSCKVTYLCLDRDDYSSGLLLKKSGLSITEKWRGSSASPTSLREWLRPERSPFFLLWLIEMQVDSWLFSAKLKICLGDYQLFYSNIR